MLTLDALAIDPDRFYDGKHDIFLALRSAFNGVKNARTDADIARVEDLLWQTALKLERGRPALGGRGIAQAADDDHGGAGVRRAAGSDRRTAQALQRSDAALHAGACRQSHTGKPGGAAEPGARTLGENDLNTLLKTIQQLSQAGDREAAAKLDGAAAVHAGEHAHRPERPAAAGAQTPQNKKLNDAIQKFGGLMGKQRDLLDKTFRQQQGQGDPKDGGAQGLQKQQNDLEKELQDSLKGMDGKSAEKMREAGKAMGEAGQALGRKDFGNAGSAQNQALDALRQGAQELADEAGQNGRQAGRARRPAGPQRLAPGRYRHRRFPVPPIWRAPAPFWKSCAAAPRR